LPWTNNLYGANTIVTLSQTSATCNGCQTGTGTRVHAMAVKREQEHVLILVLSAFANIGAA